MKKVIIASLMIIVPLTGTILSRSTFEAWEGSLNWTTSTGGNGAIVKEWEDPDNDYQTQSHGRWSMQIYDPDNSSYANAYKTFTNSANEYMVEFYLWIYHSHAPIDSFPLCVLWNVVLPETLYPDYQYKTDIALILDTVDTPPNGGLFKILVEDSTGIQFAAYIDSTDRWYKIQIYRHNGVVDFYLDGDSIGTYSPMNSNYVSNKIVLGTTSADSLADGEVFYDDIIIATPPVGEHPRLLFDSNDLTTLRSRRTGGNTYLGITYANIWDSLKTYVNHFITETDTIVWKREGPNQTLEDTFWFPYKQFSFLQRTDTIEFWLGPQRRVASELLALAFVSLVDDTAATTRSHAESLLISLSHWQMWNDPYFLSAWRQYIQLGVGHFMYSIALSYDWLYDSLSDYERLSIQNTLINLGINQTYLEAIYGGWGQYTDKWPNAVAVMIGGMGISCLALDSDDLTNELDTAKTRIDDLLGDQDVCDSTGGFAEGVSYGGYATDYLVTFTAAEDSLSGYTSGNKFLGNYPDWRIWCMLPGAENYYSDPYYRPTYWDITFCDYDRLGARWTTGIALIADSTDNSEARWYLKRRKDIRFTERDSECNRWDLYLPFGLFLWTDNSMDTTKPAPDTLLQVFDGIGWAITRTGWNDSDYLLGLKSGNWFTPHNHREQGSFIFGSEGRWLIADMGYGRDRPLHNGAQFHNLLFESNSENLYKCSHILESHFSNDSTKGVYSYLRSIGEPLTGSVSLWQRNILFFNKLGSFAVMDYAEENQDISSISWQIHTWVQPVISDSGREIKISYSGVPNLLGYVVYPKPDSTETSTIDGVYYNENSTRYDFRRIRVNLPTEDVDTFRVVVGFAPYENEDSVAVTSITGVNFKGAKLKNEKGCAAALFGMRDNLEGGTYEVSVVDSLLNIVCNLVLDTSYLVITKKGAEDETIDTLPTNDVGILSFKLNSTGDWKVIITLARTTGEIKINQDQSYCNLPYVVLNLQSLNPFTGQAADSMKIWQHYIPQPETLRYTYSTGWIPFDTTYFWYLHQGEGANTVYAQFMCDGWNESVEYCDSIIFDKIAPTGSFVINDTATFTNTSSVTLNNSMSDSSSSMQDTSGMSKMRYSNKFLENFVKNSGFDNSDNWESDTAIYHDSLKLFEIPVQTTGNYFYQTILPESLEAFDNDTLLLWIDLVDSAFTGTGKVEFLYIYGPPMREDSIDPRGQYPFGTTITIPQGTNARVSHYNLFSYFKYHPDPQGGDILYEARVRVFVDAGDMNTGKLFIDNLRLDLVSPFDSSRFENYDSLKEWTLTSGNGVRKVYGQFADGAGNETGVLCDSIIVDTTKPAANISSPEDKQKISDNVGITGWAHDYADPEQHFKQYELKYQEYEGADTAWYWVRPDSLSTTPKNPSEPPQILGRWNTQEVTDNHGNGWYYLKLTVRDLAANNQDDTIRVYVDNSIGRDGEISGFSHDVYGLAAQDEIYIGEIGTGKIYRYNTNYQLIDTFNLIDSVGIGFPLAMAIDDSGKLWAANITSHFINRFTPQGNLLLQFGSGFSLPSGIGFDNSGNIWVSDRMHHKIKKFDQNGNQLFQFGTRGSEYGEIKRPTGIALYDDKIYIAESRNRRISVFDTLGDFIRVIGESAGLLMPFGLVIDSTGCIFVSDFLGDRVIEFGPSGNQLLEIDSILDAPSGLALSPDANILYVSDTKHKRVLAFEVRSEPQGGGGPQSHSDVYINRLMFDVYPSIFSEQLNIRLQGLGQGAGDKVLLNIYDVTGRLVKSFSRLTPDALRPMLITWYGNDNQGRQVSCGVYFIRLAVGSVGETPDYIETKKAILLK